MPAPSWDHDETVGIVSVVLRWILRSVTRPLLATLTVLDLRSSDLLVRTSPSLEAGIDGCASGRDVSCRAVADERVVPSVEPENGTVGPSKPPQSACSAPPIEGSLELPSHKSYTPGRETQLLGVVSDDANTGGLPRASLPASSNLMGDSCKSGARPGIGYEAESRT